MRVTPGILKRFLEDVYTGKINKSESGEWMLPSIQNPKKMKLAVNVNKGVAIDFIGGKGYTGLDLIYHLGNFESISEAKKWVSSFVLKNISTLDISEFTQPQERAKKKAPITTRIELPKNLVPMSDKHLYAEFARNYMYRRGFTDNDFDIFHLSVCIAGNFERRIIIPFIENNEIVFYQGRAINPKADLRYLSPAGISVSVLVFNIDNLKDHAILCEGPLDAMKCNGLAIMGSSLSDWQVTKILVKKPQTITIVPDNDKIKTINGKRQSIGYVGAVKSIKKLIGSGFDPKNIKVCFVTGSKDFGDLDKANVQELLKNSKNLTFSTLLKFHEYGGVDIVKDKSLIKLL